NGLALNAISGYDEKDGTSAPVSVPDFTADLTGDIKAMKIALPKEYLGEGVQPGVREALLIAAETFKSLGATMEEVSLP
ncbi:amidase family protein, partial [Enterococcus faecalis]|uniref:amidase family protein n=1 Tax=Enterococcus faecalis TaxID=1351 RepID=UPI003D6AEC53